MDGDSVGAAYKLPRKGYLERRGGQVYPGIAGRVGMDGMVHRGKGGIRFIMSSSPLLRFFLVLNLWSGLSARSSLPFYCLSL